MRLPEPMLAKSGPLPDGPEWRFELKLDGFRAIVSTTGGLRVRSRRGWDMTALVPELVDLLPRLTLDGELVAFGEDKLPSFPRLCERMLHRKPGIPVAYMIFDVLERDGLATLNWSYRQRRELLVFRCDEAGCTGHRTSMIDWEIGENYRKTRGRPPEERLRLVYERWMGLVCGPSRDTHFYAGNLAKRHNTFVLLGAFWPPKQRIKPSQELALF